MYTHKANGRKVAPYSGRKSTIDGDGHDSLRGVNDRRYWRPREFFHCPVYSRSQGNVGKGRRTRNNEDHNTIATVLAYVKIF